jgi:hypothetical protein
VVDRRRPFSTVKMTWLQYYVQPVKWSWLGTRAGIDAKAVAKAVQESRLNDGLNAATSGLRETECGRVGARRRVPVSNAVFVLGWAMQGQCRDACGRCARKERAQPPMGFPKRRAEAARAKVGRSPTPPGGVTCTNKDVFRPVTFT